MKRMKTILFATILLFCISIPMMSTASAATYTTVSGDTLYKISQVYNTSPTILMTDNHLTSTMLSIGQKLAVNYTTYTVKQGDTLYAISVRYGVPLAAIRSANRIYTDLISVGQVLNLPQRSSYTADEVDLLAKLIRAEAQGESYQAKVAVGAVVMNRVKSTLWPNTIGTVIYQNINGYYQFTPVVNRTIYQAADADSVNAAKATMSGVDPTNGAMFYYDTSSTNAWMLSKKVSIRIDHMVFAY